MAGLGHGAAHWRRRRGRGIARARRLAGGGQLARGWMGWCGRGDAGRTWVGRVWFGSRPAPHGTVHAPRRRGPRRATPHAPAPFPSTHRGRDIVGGVGWHGHGGRKAPPGQRSCARRLCVPVQPAQLTSPPACGAPPAFTWCPPFPNSPPPQACPSPLSHQLPVVQRRRLNLHAVLRGRRPQLVQELGRLLVIPLVFYACGNGWERIVVEAVRVEYGTVCLGWNRSVQPSAPPKPPPSLTRLVRHAHKQ